VQRAQETQEHLQRMQGAGPLPCSQAATAAGHLPSSSSQARVL